MAEAFKRLAQQRLPATGGTRKLYDVPADTETIIKAINLSNNTGTAYEVTLYHTDNNESAADDEQIILPGVSIAAGGFAEWEGTMTMAATTEIHGWAAIGGEVTFTIWGIEIS